MKQFLLALLYILISLYNPKLTLSNNVVLENYLKHYNGLENMKHIIDPDLMCDFVDRFNITEKNLVFVYRRWNIS